MGVILDSSVTIRAERTRTSETELLEQVQLVTDDPIVGLSAIGVTEIVHGIYRADTQARAIYRRTFLDRLLKDLPVFDYTVEVAKLAGRIDGERTAVGNSIPLVDLMIAATAMSHGFSVLTSNLRHLRKIPGLQVIPF
jgi:predicted nucleic acid-binding protein